MKNLPISLLILAVTFLSSLSTLSAQSQEEKDNRRPNLLANYNFEKELDQWTFSCWHKNGSVAVDREVKRGETPSMKITNSGADDSFCKQVVKVKKNTRYRLSGYIKTEKVVVKGGQAASVALEGGFEATDSVKGTSSWKKFDFEFDTEALETIKVGPRLGGHGSMATGTAWYDDLRLIELGPSRKKH